jgi:putative ABC transport system permease protein
VSSWRVLLSRIAGLATRRRRDEALGAEIDQHLELLTEDYVRQGLSPAAAADAARRAFGGVDRIRSLHREQSGFPAVDASIQDLRFALRMLVRNPGFALMAVFVVGLGIGINNMMFTLIYGITMRGLPIVDPDRVLFVSSFDPRVPDRPLSFPEFDDLRRHASSFESVTAFVNSPVAVSDEGRAPDRFDGTWLSANAFALIGTAPALGRTFTERDDRPGAAPVAILGATVWRTRYASDPAILGRSILVDGVASTVVGVMAEPSRFPSTAEVWIPLSRLPTLDTQNRASRQLRVLGRLRPGVTLDAARAEVEALIDRSARAHPETSLGQRARIVPIHQRFFGDPTQTTWLAFSTAAMLILVVSCANAANVMLARAGLRAREIAIRGSLGATRLRVIYQLLVESTVIAGLAGAVGLAVSLASVRVFRSAVPADTLPYWTHFDMDGRILVALVVTSFATVLFFGLVPAIQASRTDVNHVLKDGGRGSTGRGSVRHLTTGFLVAEFALTVVLLAPLVESYRRDAVNPPSDAVLDTTQVVSASVTLPATKYSNLAERIAFFERLGERLRVTRIVEGFSVASALPLSGSAQRPFEIEGRPRVDLEQALTISTVVVGPRYFETLALSLLKGRDFLAADGLPGQEVAIINEAFAAAHFADTDPIGRQIRVVGANPQDAAAIWLSIVGVAPNIRQRTAFGAEGVVYLPFRALAPGTISVLVRSKLAPADMTTMLRAEVMAIDPYLPLYRVMTLAAVVDEAQWNPRVSHRLISTLTLIALCVCLVGLYAVTAHSVTQRSQEIGIRMALGAEPSNVRGLILRRAIVQVGLGLVVGVAGSAVWNSVFGTGRLDSELIHPSVLVPVCAVLAAVTVVACIVPIRRATSLDPVVALRQE